MGSGELMRVKVLFLLTLVSAALVSAQELPRLAVVEFTSNVNTKAPPLTPGVLCFLPETRVNRPSWPKAAGLFSFCMIPKTRGALPGR